jgi:hypothetical protein
MGWVCAEVAGTITWRHPDRARTFRVLFSHRYLHYPQHSAQLAIIDLPALGGSASPKAMADHIRVPNALRTTRSTFVLNQPVRDWVDRLL